MIGDQTDGVIGAVAFIRPKVSHKCHTSSKVWSETLLKFGLHQISNQYIPHSNRTRSG